MNLGTELTINTGTRQFTLVETGNLSADGVTGQALYSKLKELWKSQSTLIPHPFPMTAITPEQFEFINDWEPAADATRNLIRTAGWREVDESSVIKRERVGIISLGSFEDSVNDLAYYQVGNDPTDTSAAINFTYNGPLNEAIQTYAETIGPSASLVISGALDNNTITRGSGSWITDGYKVGAHATILDPEDPANAVTRQVIAVSATVLTLAGAALTSNAADATASASFGGVYAGAPSTAERRVRCGGCPGAGPRSSPEHVSDGIEGGLDKRPPLPYINVNN